MEYDSKVFFVFFDRTQIYMDESTDAISKDGSHQSLECRGCIAITHLHYLASKRAKYCSECCLMDVMQLLRLTSSGGEAGLVSFQDEGRREGSAFG